MKYRIFKTVALLPLLCLQHSSTFYKQLVPIFPSIVVRFVPDEDEEGIRLEKGVSLSLHSLSVEKCASNPHFGVTHSDGRHEDVLSAWEPQAQMGRDRGVNERDFYR